MRIRLSRRLRSLKISTEKAIEALNFVKQEIIAQSAGQNWISKD